MKGNRKIKIAVFLITTLLITSFSVISFADDGVLYTDDNNTNTEFSTQSAGETSEISTQSTYTLTYSGSSVVKKVEQGFYPYFDVGDTLTLTVGSTTYNYEFRLDSSGLETHWYSIDSAPGMEVRVKVIEDLDTLNVGDTYHYRVEALEGSKFWDLEKPEGYYEWYKSDVFQGVIIAHTHTFGEWKTTTPATIDHEGVSTRTCTKCGYSETKSIPKMTPVLPLELSNLPGVKISKPSAAKKAVTVKWKKPSKKNLKKIQGIEIQVAVDPGFTQIVKSTTAGKKKTSKKIKGLQSKRTYWVRVRTYKNAAYGKHVSAWKTKKVKVK